MEEQLRGMEVFSKKLKLISDRLEEIVAAESQTDTEIHMVSDSIDVISDTSDTIFGITEFMKEKNNELKEVSDYHREEAEEAVNRICDLLEECADMESIAEDEDLKNRLGELAQGRWLSWYPLHGSLSYPDNREQRERAG